jgi:hypothetical protein
MLVPDGVLKHNAEVGDNTVDGGVIPVVGDPNRGPKRNVNIREDTEMPYRDRW